MVSRKTIEKKLHTCKLRGFTNQWQFIHFTSHHITTHHINTLVADCILNRMILFYLQLEYTEQ